MTSTCTIAIDGPAASGKSTVGERLAQRLGYLYFDTGVMYRAVTWACLQRRVAPGDAEAVSALARALTIDVLPPDAADAAPRDGRQVTVLADGADVTWAIREPEVDANVSEVSAHAGVRQAMVSQQRRIAAQRPVVMVGRDIGTVVLPDADLKVYLDASVEVRARRRWQERQAKGDAEGYEQILAAMRRRDRIDSQRQVSPLRQAADAVRVDSTDLGIEETVNAVAALVREAGCLAA